MIDLHLPYRASLCVFWLSTLLEDINWKCHSNILQYGEFCSNPHRSYI